MSHKEVDSKSLRDRSLTKCAVSDHPSWVTLSHAQRMQHQRTSNARATVANDGAPRTC
jgi:hypothetical protein